MYSHKVLQRYWKQTPQIYLGTNANVTKYRDVNGKLSNLQIDKTKSTIKYDIEVTLRLIIILISDNETFFLT